MYRGKFEAGRPASTPTKKPAEAPVRTGAPTSAEAPAAAPVRRAAAAPKQEAPVRRTAVSPKQEAPARANTEAPARRNPQGPRKKQKRRMTKGTFYFYCGYTAFVLLFCVVLGIAMIALNGWLVRFESSQPNVKSQEVFDELFANPDWEEIYNLAGLADTQFETKENYVAYMKDKVSSTPLTYIETSAGLSGDHKYVVKLGDEKLAVYTLTAEPHSETDIVEWKLGSIEFFLAKTATICTAPDRTVYINGKLLDTSYTISTVTTAAQEYLPDGVNGFQAQYLQVDGLLTEPEVTATDKDGKAVEIAYDEKTGVYTEVFPTMEISEDEEDNAITAAKTYCKFMIGAVGESSLRKSFDSSRKIYKTICQNDTWMQSYNGYSFSEAEVTDYYRYSDDLYSARVIITLNVTRKDGSNKEYPVNSTFFFEKGSNGKWLVWDMTNVHVQERQTEVKLVFKNGDQVLSSEMVDAEIRQLKLPAVTAPEGKVFTGWFQEIRNANGSKTMSLVFAPSENNTVSLPAPSVLSPMTLHAMFEDAGGQ